MEISGKILKRQIVNPHKMPPGCSFAPTKTLTYKELESKQVIKSVNDMFITMKGKLCFTFRFTPQGGVGVSVTYVDKARKTEHNIKQLEISKPILQELKRAKNADLIALPTDDSEKDAFMICHSKALSDLLDKIARN